MSMPLFPIARRFARRLAAVSFALLAGAAPVFSQVERPPIRPVPGDGGLTFDAAFVANPTVIAGRSVTLPLTLSCKDGESRVELSVRVNPEGPTVTVDPLRLSLPGTATVTFATNAATPSGSYLVTLSARVVSGKCVDSSRSFVVEVQRPFRLEVDPVAASAPPGGQATYDVRIRRGGMEGAIDLRTSGLPAGFNAVFVPNPAIGLTSTLRVTVPNPTNQCPPPNGCPFQIRGQAPKGVQVDAAEARLLVERNVRFTASPQSSEASSGSTVRVQIPIERSGYVGPVSLMLVGDPRTMIVIAPMNGTVGNLYWLDITLPQGVSGNVFRFTATPVLPPGTVGVTVTPVDFDITVPFDFSVSIRATPVAQAVIQSQPAFLDLEITRMNVGPVWYLGVNGLPAGARAEANQEVDPSRVTIFTSPLTPPGTYVLSVQGQYLDPNGFQPFVFSNPVELTVLGSTTPRVRLTADPASLTVLSGQVATSTISAQRDNCNGTITLTRPATLPPEIADLSFSALGSDRFSARVVAGTVATPRTVWVPIGAQVTGCSGVDVQGAMLAVTVQPVSGGSAQLSLQPAQISVAAGSAATTALQITRSGSIGAVSLAAVGLPAGVTATFSPNPAAGNVATVTITAAAGVPNQTKGFQVTGSASGGSVAPASGTVTVTAQNPPVITAFTPPNGSAGTSVQIFGTGFENVQNVLFTGPNGGVGAAFALVSPTQVNATVPGFAATGPIRVVTAAGTATSATSFLVGSSNQAPQITGFSPASGGAGTSVRITGVNFTGTFDVSFGTPTFGFLPIGFTTLGGTQIDVLIPAGTPSGFFRVSTAAGTATSATAFQVTTPNLPEIGGFNPISGGPGTRVEIVGSNLGTATQVTFNGAPASFEPPQPNRIFATVPPNASTGPIRVVTPAGTATSFTPFAVSNGEPVITGFQPPSGRAGDSVTIAGVNFTGVTQVTINGFLAPIGIVTSNFVQVFVPEAATSGPIRLTTLGGTAISPSPFTVLP